MRGWGVDGCRGGWFFVGLGEGEPEFGVVPDIATLVDLAGRSDPIFIDIPIGLRDSGGPRLCDEGARRLLSPRRGSSVFPAPCRGAVYASSYREAQAQNRNALKKGLSRQSWAIAPKIREVDQLLRQRVELRGRIREVHPEVCFCGLAGAPMAHSKKTREGFEERVTLLEDRLPLASSVWRRAFLEYGGFEASRDDIVDALVVALSATRSEECLTLPPEPEVDSEGLRMEMVYWRPARAG